MSPQSFCASYVSSPSAPLTLCPLLCPLSSFPHLLPADRRGSARSGASPAKGRWRPFRGTEARAAQAAPLPRSLPRASFRRLRTGWQNARSDSAFRVQSALSSPHAAPWRPRTAEGKLRGNAAARRLSLDEKLRADSGDDSGGDDEDLSEAEESEFEEDRLAAEMVVSDGEGEEEEDGEGDAKGRRAGGFCLKDIIRRGAPCRPGGVMPHPCLQRRKELPAALGR